MAQQNNTHMQSSMLSTKEFIRRKCSKDHFVPSVSTHPKHSSVYAIEYKKSKKLELYQKNKENIGKQRNTCSKERGEYLLPPASVYRNSFENNDAPKPIRHHQKPSYFLKTENYEPLQSTYHRASILKPDEFNSKQLKGKPQMDHLSIAKYNKMNTKSLYRDSFLEFTRLPSIYEKDKQMVQKATGNKMSSFHEGAEKTCNIR